MEPFATAERFHSEGFRSPDGLTDKQIDRQLMRASRTIRAEAPTVDERIQAGELDPEMVADIACEMVEAAAPVDAPLGAQSVSQGTGPFSQSITFANPRGDLFLTGRQRRILGTGKRRRPFTIHVGTGQP